MCLSHLNILLSFNCYQVCEGSKLPWNSTCECEECGTKAKLIVLLWILLQELDFLQSSLQLAGKLIRDDILRHIYKNKYVLSYYHFYCMFCPSEREYDSRIANMLQSRHAEVLNNHQRRGEKAVFWWDTH